LSSLSAPIRRLRRTAFCVNEARRLKFELRVESWRLFSAEHKVRTAVIEDLQVSKAQCPPCRKEWWLAGEAAKTREDKREESGRAYKAKYAKEPAPKAAE
jgi:hypothetical protein